MKRLFEVLWLPIISPENIIVFANLPPHLSYSLFIFKQGDDKLFVREMSLIAFYDSSSGLGCVRYGSIGWTQRTVI